MSLLCAGMKFGVDVCVCFFVSSILGTSLHLPFVMKWVQQPGLHAYVEMESHTGVFSFPLLHPPSVGSARLFCLSAVYREKGPTVPRPLLSTTGTNSVQSNVFVYSYSRHACT